MANPTEDSRLRRLVACCVAALALTAPVPALATPSDGLMPDLRGSSAWSMVYGWEGTEMNEGTGHRVVVNKQEGDAMYSVSLAQKRVAGKIDSSYLVAMRDIYAPLDFVTEFETRTDEVLNSLLYAMGLDPKQSLAVRNISHQAIQAEGGRSYHVIVGKLIFHCASYLPTSVTQGWTLTVVSMASEHHLAKGIVAQLKAQNAKREKVRLNHATKLRAARDWRSLYGHSRAWLAELPGSQAAWLFLGESAVEIGKTAEAIPALRKALKGKRGDAKLWKKLGYAYALTRNWKESGVAYQKALERNPKDAESLWNLGIAYAYQQRYTALPGIHLRLRAVDPVLAERFSDSLLAQLAVQQSELGEDTASYIGR